MGKILEKVIINELLRIYEEKSLLLSDRQAEDVQEEHVVLCIVLTN